MATERKAKAAAVIETTAVLLIPPYGKSVEAMLEKLRADPAIELIECRSPLEAPQLVAKNEYAVLLCNTSEAAELVKQVTMLKLLQEETAEHRVRTVIVTAFNQVAILSRLAFYGCSEIIQEPIQPKPLMFKVMRHVRALAQANKHRKRTNKRVQGASGDELGLKSHGEGANEETRVNYVSPLASASDFWVLPWKAATRSGADNRWVIKMMGPPPDAGIWTKVESDKIGQERWCLRLSNSEREKWVPDAGDWYFRGEQPKFEEGHWIFAGTDPELAFINEGKTLGSKITLDRTGDLTGVLTLARNSARAEALEKTYIDQGRSKDSKGGPVENPIFVEPLFIESDCWLMHGKKPREIGGRWIVKLKGPGPQCGRWEEIPDPGLDSSSEDRLWKWVPPVPGDDPFIKEAGQWVFHGRAPKFESDGWLFISDKPELAFRNEGEVMGAKVRMMPEGIVAIAQDSNAALEKLSMIESTMNLVKRLSSGSGEAGDLVHIRKDQGGTDVYGNGGPAAEQERPGEIAEFRMPAELFGLPVGHWEEVLGQSDTKPHYVYVPTVLLDSADKAPDVRALEVYWCFVGVMPPRLDESGEAPEWVFKGEEPVPYHAFRMLPDMIQRYLLNRFAHVDLPSEMGSAFEPAAGKRARREGGASEALIEIEVPTGPVLSPLTLAFLLSELMGKPGQDRSDLVQKACNYLSASCGGVRTELWVRPEGQAWRCAGSYDGTEGEYAEVAGAMGAEPALLENGMVVVPVKVPRADYDAAPAGAVLMAPGEGVQADIQYATAVGRIFAGLVQGLV